MIKLNDRLQIIAEQLKHEKTMADIGTDHGFCQYFYYKVDSVIG